MKNRASSYAQAVNSHGAPLERCVGFMDCKKIHMLHPGGIDENKRTCFYVHRSFHCLIYQTITTPHELIFNMYGPKVRRWHDMTLYRQREMEVLQNNLLLEDQNFYVYGDLEYILRPWIQFGFHRAFASPEQLLQKNVWDLHERLWNSPIKTWSRFGVFRTKNGCWK